MSDRPPALPLASSAGALLRHLREARGVDLDMLASSLKVPTRKLELLESDQYDALPGMAFVRGLALAVCRYLDTDAQAVLALLPQALAPGAQNELEHVTRGLAAPFREPGGSHDSRRNLAHWLRLPLLLPLGLLVAAALFWFLPDLRGVTTSLSTRLPSFGSNEASSAAGGAQGVTTSAYPSGQTTTLPASASAADIAAAQQAAAANLPASAVVETVFSAPIEDPAASTRAPAAAAGSLVLRTTAASWVEVSDGANKVLLARMLTPGETVGLDGSLPMKAKIGNASGTEVTFRGKRVDLVPLTRENVARVELK
jgi:cytoskeleton protein RodZ